MSASLDGEGRPEDSFVLDHLRRCGECREVARRLAWLHEALRVPVRTPGVDLAEVVPVGHDGGEPAPRPCCAGTESALYVVGNAACGCTPGCGCGCQDGRRCRCGHEVA